MASVLLLSAAGIHALMAFTVARRRREIGIRSALGARPRSLLAGVFRRATLQLAAGALGGFLVAGLLDRLAGGEILQGRAALLLPAVAVFMVVVGLLAAMGPALRGLRIEPVEALRGIDGGALWRPLIRRRYASRQWEVVCPHPEKIHAPLSARRCRRRRPGRVRVRA